MHLYNNIDRLLEYQMVLKEIISNLRKCGIDSEYAIKTANDTWSDPQFDSFTTAIMPDIKHICNIADSLQSLNDYALQNIIDKLHAYMDNI